MKEQLISLLTSKVGLDQEKATQAVDTILDYVKSNPEQLSQILGKVGAAGVADKIGGMLG